MARVLKPCTNYCEEAHFAPYICEQCPWSKEMEEYEEWKHQCELKRKNKKETCK